MRLNALCSPDDWHDPHLVAAMRRMLPYYVEAFPDFPTALEHRKHWEFAQLLVGLEKLGALTPRAFVISVGAGHEEPIFDLTNKVRWVFATDIYGSGEFRDLEASGGMLMDPSAFARCPYRRERLVVQYMDALDIRHEDDTFDAAISASSIEHFGGMDGTVRALEEMARVVRPGGIVAVTTECITNGAPRWSEPGLELFTPDDIRSLARSVDTLRPIGPVDLDVSRLANVPVIPLERALADAERGHIEYPHVVLELHDRHWTSVSLFFRKRRRSRSRGRARPSGSR
jgi:SAM-dependent methyltransferase